MDYQREAHEEYQKAYSIAMRNQLKDKKQNVAPYPSVLDAILNERMISCRQDLGVMDIPTNLIVGVSEYSDVLLKYTKDFLPLADPNSQIATQWRRAYQLRQQHVVIGNGAAELIKSLMQSNRFEKVGFIRPTFEEYPNRFYNEAVVYDTTENGFRYNAEDIMQFFGDKEIDALVVINPDNPSGNYMDVTQLKQLISWSKEKGITLIVDESFVDFVSTHEDECWQEYSLLTEEILASYEGLYVVKSISKSYGVPGFRLGILASANGTLIAEIKKDVAIWNINSFGEFFMQIYEKYQKDYAASLKKIKHARAVFEEALSHISGIKVIPSQANYVMCELNSITSRDLAVALLERNVFIKDLSSKIGNGKQYIRLAVRSEEENEYLIKQLKELL